LVCDFKIYFSIIFNKSSPNPPKTQNRHANLKSGESMSAKAQAARINGALSNGPITEEGKARSAQNSLKHGLTSTQVVLPHESQSDYDALEAAIIARFKPEDEFEVELAREMAAARWRLRRIQVMESAYFKKVMREHQERLGPDTQADDVRDAAYAEIAESKTMRNLVRHQGQLRRAYEKAWKELLELQNIRQEEEQTDEEQNEPMGAQLTPQLLEKLPAPPNMQTEYAFGTDWESETEDSIDAEDAA
jgi:hypothetical protein